MTSVERFLMNLDTWPVGALLRIGLGLSIPPLFRLILGGDSRIWPALILFLVLLLSLRLVPAVFRRAFAFSREAKDLWFERRSLGKRYDSYQWQKLFWMGLGMLPYAPNGRGIDSGEFIVLTICLVGGGLGLLFWRRTGVGYPATVTVAANLAPNTVAPAQQ